MMIHHVIIVASGRPAGYNIEGTYSSSLAYSHVTNCVTHTTAAHTTTQLGHVPSRRYT
jgi:hypothetical protein